MPYNYDMTPNFVRSAFMARLQAESLKAKDVVEEHRYKFAEALLSAGLAIIPSEHLQDNQIIVSRGVYEAAQKVVKARQ